MSREYLAEWSIKMDYLKVSFCGTALTIDSIAETLLSFLRDKAVKTEKSQDRVDIILQDDTALSVIIPPQADSPDKVMAQLRGMANFYGSKETDHKEIQKMLITQISMWDSIFGVEFLFTDNNERNSFLYSQIIHTANKLNSYLIMNNLDIINGENKLVFNPEGKSDLEKLTPTVTAKRLVPNKAEPTAEDNARYNKNIQKLKKENIPYMEHMKLALAQGDIRARSKEEILSRGLCIFACALYSEFVMTEENHDNKKALDAVNRMEQMYGIMAHMTPQELEYINSEEFNEQNTIKYSWQYECAATMMWAVGLIEELNPTNEICNVSAMARLVLDGENIENLLGKTKELDIETLMEAQDLMMRYHWSFIESRVKKTAEPTGFNIGVVIERQKAFNWMLTDIFGSDWDHIQTPA